jgi:uncharacterized Zn finger protein
LKPVRTVTVECPWCGESFEINLEHLAPQTDDYLEECPYCCFPVDLIVRRDADGHVVHVEVNRDEE